MGFLGSLFQHVMNAFGGGNQAQGGAAGAAAAPAQKGGGGLMDMFNPSTMAGLGIMGAGQLMNKQTKMPDFNNYPQVQALQNFSHNPPVLPQGMQDEINNSMGIQQEQELRNLRDVYKNARPGTDYTTDSAYQRDLGNLQRNQTSARANAMMGPTLQYQQPQIHENYNQLYQNKHRL
jgi:hypothetical protein